MLLYVFYKFIHIKYLILHRFTTSDLKLGCCFGTVFHNLCSASNPTLQLLLFLCLGLFSLGSCIHNFLCTRHILIATPECERMIDLLL